MWLSILSFIWNNKRFFTVFTLVSLYFVVYYVGYYKGYSAGKARIEYITLEKIVERKVYIEKKKKQIRELSNDDLVKRYCKWVHDIPYDECLRTVSPVE